MNNPRKVQRQLTSLRKKRDRYLALLSVFEKRHDDSKNDLIHASVGDRLIKRGFTGSIEHSHDMTPRRWQNAKDNIVSLSRAIHDVQGRLSCAKTVSPEAYSQIEESLLTLIRNTLQKTKEHLEEGPQHPTQEWLINAWLEEQKAQRGY